MNDHRPEMNRLHLGAYLPKGKPWDPIIKRKGMVLLRHPRVCDENHAFRLLSGGLARETVQKLRTMQTIAHCHRMVRDVWAGRPVAGSARVGVPMRALVLSFPPFRLDVADERLWKEG